jgi:hypothetical protein
MRQHLASGNCDRYTAEFSSAIDAFLTPRRGRKESNSSSCLVPTMWAFLCRVHRARMHILRPPIAGPSRRDRRSRSSDSRRVRQTPLRATRLPGWIWPHADGSCTLAPCRDAPRRGRARGDETVTFPTYRLLSFRRRRSSPCAYAKRADCLMCDGQGLAPPPAGYRQSCRHLVDLPTIGCAKSPDWYTRRPRSSRFDHPLRDGDEISASCCVHAPASNRSTWASTPRDLLRSTAPLPTGYRIPEPTRRGSAAARASTPGEPSPQLVKENDINARSWRLTRPLSSVTAPARCHRPVRAGTRRQTEARRF